MKKIELKVNHLERNSNKKYIYQYLETLGIKYEDVDSFISQPRNEDEEPPMHLDNISAAADAIDYAARKKMKFFIQVDSDTDGYTSSAILINYLKRRYGDIDIIWRLHAGKEHGVIVDTVPEDTGIVIIPDAGTNQFVEHKALHDKGMIVVVLDHHELEEPNIEDSPAIIVNNQISKFCINKSLSGAGVVYKLIKYMDSEFFTDKIYQNYGDLAAIGIISDAMNMTTLDNNYIAYWGLKHIHSQFIEQVAIKQSRGIKNPQSLTKIDVAFYIAPVINGVIRSGAPEDKQMVFRALIEENNTEDFVREWRGTTYHETLYECAARLAMNAKARQDAAKKKSFEWLCEKIRDKGWDKDNIIIVPLDAKESLKVSPNITGLISMELVKEFNKPALVLRQTELDGKMVYGGSGRNGNFHNLPDLKQALQNSNEVYYTAGHANAFGVFIEEDHINQIREYFLSHYKSEEFNDKVYAVDYWFHTGEKIDSDMLLELASYDDLWGNSIPQPKLAFSLNLKQTDLFIMGKDSSSLKIRNEGIDFVSFCNLDLINNLKQEFEKNPIIHIDLVGRPQLNVWMGKYSIQVIIDDIAVNDYQTRPINDLI